MKCGEPKPGSSYATCDKNLRHSGDHRYLNQPWPRPVPADADWDVNELLDSTVPRNCWDYMERSFPVVVVETVTKVIWVDAEDEDQALGRYADDDWSDIPLRDAETLEADLEFRRLDKYEREEAFASRRHGAKVGPQIACPDCGRLAFRREWMHDPMRKCHGPIEWRERQSSLPAWRYQREYKSTPVFDAARQAVAS
ncbi:hypothetical protein ACIQVR_41830 [Streptomyces xanthochromogenes]|uniref:hypothetical protein n=1 Tax=Streptomyces xanthochromogenes TaxID=67384 RepID=UPI00380CA462